MHFRPFVAHCLPEQDISLVFRTIVTRHNNPLHDVHVGSTTFLSGTTFRECNDTENFMPTWLGIQMVAAFYDCFSPTCLLCVGLLDSPKETQLNNRSIASIALI